MPFIFEEEANESFVAVKLCIVVMLRSYWYRRENQARPPTVSLLYVPKFSYFFDSKTVNTGFCKNIKQLNWNIAVPSKQNCKQWPCWQIFLTISEKTFQASFTTAVGALIDSKMWLSRKTTISSRQSPRLPFGAGATEKLSWMIRLSSESNCDSVSDDLRLFLESRLR